VAGLFVISTQKEKLFRNLTLSMTTRQLQRIGTHDGTFHCDEALAVFLLRQTPQFEKADLIRTRDPELLNQCSIVVDVGAVYDPSTLRFDHHQRGFSEILGQGFNTKLSSAGLIYKHYGEEIIARRLGREKIDPIVQILHKKLYQEFIEGIDGIDNGVSQYPSELKPNYKVRTDLSSRVSWLNPAWNERCDRETVDAKFLKASALTGSEFFDRLDYYSNSWIPAREIVSEALKSRTIVDASGRILLLKTFAPWKDHLFDIENETNLKETDQPLYVIYQDETGGNWRVQAVPTGPDSFESRKALPTSWRGLRDAELSILNNIPGCIFVHSSGFIGGNATKEGALRMAQESLCR